MYFIRTIYLGFRDLSGREKKRILKYLYLLEEVIVSNEEVIVAFIRTVVVIVCFVTRALHAGKVF